MFFSPKVSQYLAVFEIWALRVVTTYSDMFLSKATRSVEGDRSNRGNDNLPPTTKMAINPTLPWQNIFFTMTHDNQYHNLSFIYT